MRVGGTCMRGTISIIINKRRCECQRLLWWWRRRRSTWRLWRCWCDCICCDQLVIIVQIYHRLTITAWTLQYFALLLVFTTTIIITYFYSYLIVNSKHGQCICYISRRITLQITNITFTTTVIFIFIFIFIFIIITITTSYITFITTPSLVILYTTFIVR